MKESLPSSDEASRIRAAQEQADPTMYSALPPEGPLAFDAKLSGKRGIGTYTNAEGERYYALEHQPEMQQFVARLLKGIVNVSDIVRSKEQSTSRPDLFSREMPLDRIEAPASLQETKADLFILKFIFGDSDHTTYRNTLANEAGHRAYYDFASASRFFRVGLSADTAPSVDISYYQDAVPEIRRKLDLLETHLGGAAGKAFIEAIVQDAGVPLAELFDPVPKSFIEAPDQAAAFQAHLLRHIENARAAVAPPVG